MQAKTKTVIFDLHLVYTKLIIYSKPIKLYEAIDCKFSYFVLTKQV